MTRRSPFIPRLILTIAFAILTIALLAGCNHRAPTAPTERAVLCTTVSHRCVDTLWVTP
jgi:hypothetical protein